MSTSPNLSVCAIGEHITIQYAAAELALFLNRLTGQPVDVRLMPAYDAALPALWVGLATEFAGIQLPAVADTRFDDAVFVQTKAAAGIIAGNNPRSVLLAVYRFLSELGCRWVRPGADGEFVPRVDLAQTAVSACEAASYRHRGICIEGAVSYENVRDMIEWAPRNGFNAYFIQFREGYTFFDRWYSHAGNPLKQPERFTVERARELVAQAAGEIRKRDLLYHAVGHGWTCEPFGISGLGWDYPPGQVPPEVVPYLALVNGKRELWGGVPLNTNLCYSNPEVRRLVVEEIARYAAAHPEVDLLHIWLADGSNNNCECNECRKARPSDFYVMMLNEADQLLTQQGLKTRLVFLIYVDLLWPPERERLRSTDRFVLMFAPITRTYSTTFSPGKAVPQLPPYSRNRLTFPRTVEENVAFLKSWQAQFKGDSFDFDYHFMWDHVLDPGYVSVARVLQEDIQLLENIGINGYMSCQLQRAFFPTGLGMAMMGWTLWDKRRDFESMAQDYFRAAFGPDGSVCYAYLAEMSRLFDPVYLRGEKPGQDAGTAVAFGQIPKLIAQFLPVIERNARLADPCWAASWTILRHHADMAAALARTFEAWASGDEAESTRRFEVVKDMAWRREDALQSVLDVCFYVKILEGLLKVRRTA